MDQRIQGLLKKYDVPVPRYTSYPSVPHWDTRSFDAVQWLKHIEGNRRHTDNGVSVYVHLPFCESLCTYCACNTRITKNHRVEERYVDAVLKEWSLYADVFGHPPQIRELHLGGGTPTFFSPGRLRMLISGIVDRAVVHPERAFSFEGHPNNTSEAHLKALYDLGFRRVSYGVQDLHERVQRAIHRIQPFEHVAKVTDLSRNMGYESVSFDLIYGLPYQTPASVRETFSRVVDLRPDRIAFYSYAHVPWIKPGQRGYEDADLPKDAAKRELYEVGRSVLTAAGYHDIGMDHFALPSDELFKALREGRLYRNFMGYTATQTETLIGLGASAISDAGTAYAQNLKSVEDYEQAVEAGRLPVFKGHLMSAQDVVTRQLIQDISCQGQTVLPLHLLFDPPPALFDLEQDGLIIRQGNRLSVTERGRMFIRNICSVFDRRLRVADAENVFSRSI